MEVIILLAISVSLDSFGIGMSYSVTGIRIPISTQIVIGVLNGLLTFTAVFFGQQMRTVIPSEVFCIAGGSILIFLGAKSLWNALGDNKSLDFDKDDSHVLEPWEGITLGMSLALDSVSAAFSISGIGMTAYLFPVLTMLVSGSFLYAGGKMNFRQRRVNGIGGVVLVILGLFRFFSG